MIGPFLIKENVTKLVKQLCLFTRASSIYCAFKKEFSTTYLFRNRGSLKVMNDSKLVFWWPRDHSNRYIINGLTVTRKFQVSSNGWEERWKRDFYSLGYYCTPNLSIHQNSTQELTWNFLCSHFEWTRWEHEDSFRITMESFRTVKSHLFLIQIPGRELLF